MNNLAIKAIVAIALLFSMADMAVCGKKSSSSGKSVAVRGYVRKDGTYVRPHYRSAPRSSGASSYTPPPSYSPRSSNDGVDDQPTARKKELARTTARTSARTSYSRGSAALFDTDGSSSKQDEPARPSATASPARSRSPRESGAVRFHVKLADGTVVKAADVYERDGQYVISWPKGGASGYAKYRVESVEPATETIPKDRVVLVHQDGTLETYSGYLVRLLGISIPDHAGIERLSALVTNESVDLAYDTSLAKKAHRDDAGRLLAYVTRSRDKLDINTSLLREGVADVDRTRNLQRSAQFEKLASEVSH